MYSGLPALTLRLPARYTERRGTVLGVPRGLFAAHFGAHCACRKLLPLPSPVCLPGLLNQTAHGWQSSKLQRRRQRQFPHR